MAPTDKQGNPRKHDIFTNVDLMMGQRRRRWPIIKPALAECLLFTGYAHLYSIQKICSGNPTFCGADVIDMTLGVIVSTFANKYPHVRQCKALDDWSIIKVILMLHPR